MENNAEKIIEKRVENTVAGKVKKAMKPKSTAARRVGYAFSIAFNLLALWIANHLLTWQVQWVTPAWQDVLTLVNVSIWLNLVVYSVFLFFDKRTFYYVARIPLDVIAIVVSIQLYRVFPFAFEHLWGWSWLNAVAPWLILLGILGIAVAFTVRTVRFCTGKSIYD